MRSSPNPRLSPILKAPFVQDEGAPTIPAALREPSPSPQIPSALAHPPMPAVVGPDETALEKAREAAMAVLEEAHRQALEIRQDALSESREAAIRAGFKEGYDAGHREGMNAAEADAQSLLRQAETSSKRLLADQEERIALLACEIAAHLIGMELTLNPEAVERIVLTTLQEVGQGSEVEVTVAPGDYPKAVRACPVWREAVGEGTQIRLAVDDTLPQGGCRIKGPHGVVERNWQKEIMAVSDALEEVARRGL